MVFAFTWKILHRSTEAEKRPFIVPLRDHLLTALVFGLGFEGAATFRLGSKDAPSTIELFGIGLAGLLGRNRRMRLADPIEDLGRQ